MMNILSTGTGTSAQPIGQPFVVTDGPLAGKTLRAELFEVQHAERGRKFVRQDRRPIDPPPIAEFRLLEVSNTPGQQDRPLVPDEYAPFLPGLLCFVDLFPVSGPEIEAAVEAPQSGQPAVWDRPRPTDGPDTIAYVAGYPIAESTCCTSGLIGERFAHVANVSSRFMFVFADIASTLEGYFILRYRTFCVDTSLGANSVPIFAECYGQPFRVYSTQEFPGLKPSTSLTKLVNKYGVKTHIRETERTRKKRTAEGEEDE